MKHHVFSNTMSFCLKKERKKRNGAVFKYSVVDLSPGNNKKGSPFNSFKPPSSLPYTRQKRTPHTLSSASVPRQITTLLQHRTCYYKELKSHPDRPSLTVALVLWLHEGRRWNGDHRSLHSHDNVEGSNESYIYCVDTMACVEGRQ
jgi:hypothetical protein